MIDHDNLEEFSDAQDYDFRDTSDTGVAFYSSLAGETGAPVLEIACGTGRVSIPIAQMGFSVTGLDIAPGMMARARLLPSTQGWLRINECIRAAALSKMSAKSSRLSKVTMGWATAEAKSPISRTPWLPPVSPIS